MTQHTPGPWEARHWGAADHEMEDGETAFIVTAAESSGLLSRSNADARLIAAAPDLLAALKALLPVAEAFERQASKGAGGRRGGAVFAAVRAAIAKAEGRE